MGKRRNGNPIPNMVDISDKTEDPMYAMENGLPILVDYYLWNQLMRPLLKFFSPIVAPDEDIDVLVNGLSTKKCVIRFGPAPPKGSGIIDPFITFVRDLLEKGHLSQMPKRKRCIPKVPWTSDAFKILFGSNLPHMKKRRKKISQTAPLFKFMKVQFRCIGCKRAVGARMGKGAPLCKECEQRRMHHYINVYSAHEEAKDNLNAKHDTCRKCLGEGEDIFLCSNKDCSILYSRKRALMDMEDMGKRLSMFTPKDEEERIIRERMKRRKTCSQDTQKQE